MKNYRTYLGVAVLFFVIGFLANPLIALLHLPSDTAQVIISINWISGGLAFVVLDQLNKPSIP